MPKKLTYQELEDRIEALEKENTALQKDNEKLLHILNSMTEGYAQTDLEGNLLFFNDITPIYHGRAREEMTGLNYREFTAPEQIQEIFGIYNRIYRTGLTEKVKDFEIIKKDGSRGAIDATVSLLRDDSGRPIGFSTFSLEVTDRKRVKEALEEREETYQKILESVPDSIVITRRADGRYLEVNEAFCQQTGYTREEALGRTALELNLYANPSDRERILESMRKHGQVDGEQLTFQTKDGTLIYDLVSFRIIPFRGEECVLIVATVITPLIEAQKALQESEERYRKILETMEEGYYEVDLRGTFTFCNKAECRIHQRTPEEMKGLNNRQFSSPETARRIYNIYNEVYRTGVPAKIIDYGVIRKDEFRHHPGNIGLPAKGFRRESPWFLRHFAGRNRKEKGREGAGGVPPKPGKDGSGSDPGA